MARAIVSICGIITKHREGRDTTSITNQPSAKGGAKGRET